MVYKYSLSSCEAYLKKPHSVVNGLREYYGASVGTSFLLLHVLQQENESIVSWETRTWNQAAQCEYQDFAEKLMRDQFIAGLIWDALQVKLIGKGHGHKITQGKAKLQEVVEVTKTFKATVRIS